MRRPRTELRKTVLSAADPGALARFYEQLLGWTRLVDRHDWVVIADEGATSMLAFQPEPGHVEPTWPAGDEDQQMQMHLDIAVDDLAAAVAWVQHLGARLAARQPQDDVRVVLDPAGHPLCLFEALGQDG